MRRINAVVTACIMVLFVIHLIWGALLLAGLARGGAPAFTALSYVLTGLVCIHILISVKLTADTFIAARRSGVSYWKENRIFWIRRISGMALLVFIIVHVIIFTGEETVNGFILHLFDAAALASQILLVVTLVIHLITNIRPLKIAFGLTDTHDIKTDIMLVLSILLLIAALAFVVYYIRWTVI